jgi:hypothetical protein
LLLLVVVAVVIKLLLVVVREGLEQGQVFLFFQTQVTR